MSHEPSPSGWGVIKEHSLVLYNPDPSIYTTINCHTQNHTHLYEWEGDESYPEYDVEAGSDCGQLSGMELSDLVLADLFKVDDS